MATLNVSEQAKELAKEVVFEIKKQQKDKRSVSYTHLRAHET